VRTDRPRAGCPFYRTCSCPVAVHRLKVIGYSVLREREGQEGTGENCVVRSFVIRAPHQVLLR
jgi:hypothetical protein